MLSQCVCNVELPIKLKIALVQWLSTFRQLCQELVGEAELFAVEKAGVNRLKVAQKSLSPFLGALMVLMKLQLLLDGVCQFPAWFPAIF